MTDRPLPPAAVLIYVTPHRLGPGSLPTRPGRLLDALRETDRFERIVVINRRRPTFFLPPGPLHQWNIGARWRKDGSSTVVEHPWPIGPLERAELRRIVFQIARRSPDAAIVLWVADPKSAGIFSSVAGLPRMVTVFDAYDAWDFSPLEAGRFRRRSIQRGYQSAARFADLVLANTPLMRDRMARLGARRSVLLQNAAPRVADERITTSVRRHLLYIGRVHERLDASLLAAVASAIPDARVRIAGPIERTPVGWKALKTLGNITIEEPLLGPAATEAIAGAAAVLVPHIVDDYTRSQDAMKAWDALALGTAVVSTAVPPAVGWAPPVAWPAADEAEFVAAARRAVDHPGTGRTERLAFARKNTWSLRARDAVAEIDRLLT